MPELHNTMRGRKKTLWYCWKSEQDEEYPDDRRKKRSGDVECFCAPRNTETNNGHENHRNKQIKTLSWCNSCESEESENDLYDRRKKRAGDRTQGYGSIGCCLYQKVPRKCFSCTCYQNSITTVNPSHTFVPPDGEPSDELPGAVIAGAVVGSVLFLALIGVLLSYMYLRCKQDKTKRKSPSDIQVSQTAEYADVSDWYNSREQMPVSSEVSDDRNGIFAANTGNGSGTVPPHNDAQMEETGYGKLSSFCQGIQNTYEELQHPYPELHGQRQLSCANEDGDPKANQQAEYFVLEKEDVHARKEAGVVSPTQDRSLNYFVLEKKNPEHAHEGDTRAAEYSVLEKGNAEAVDTADRTSPEYFVLEGESRSFVVDKTEKSPLCVSEGGKSPHEEETESSLNSLY